MVDKHLRFFLDKLRSGEWIYEDGRVLKWIEYRKTYKEAGRLNTKGYRQLVGIVDGKEVSCVAHRVIYAFKNGLDSLPKELQINHINGIKSDNRIENLELVTNSENQKHAYKIGLKKKQRGERNPDARLSNKQVLEIKTLLGQGLSDQDIAKSFNVTWATVRHIRNGKTWSHVTGFKRVYPKKRKKTA